MSQEQTSYPLSWPLSQKRTKTPKESRFGKYAARPTVAKARDAVLLELRRIGAPESRTVISTNLKLRNDGLPYSGLREPEDSGVAVYFQRKGKPHVLACDQWRTVGENLWAIAKHIEALRGQERWGVGTMDQAFAGYAQLMEKTEPTCWEVLGIEPGRTVTEADIKAAYHAKALEAHPDHGGSTAEFEVVRNAYTIAIASLPGQSQAVPLTGGRSA